MLKNLNFKTFLTLSVLAHALLIVGVHQKSTPSKEVTYSKQVGHDTRLRTTLKFKNRLLTKKKILKTTSIAARKNIEKKRASKVSETENTSIKKVVKESIGVNSVKAKYLASVRSIIQSYRQYPLIAKRRKQFGNVGVYFEITSHGKMKNIKLHKPSRFKLLNKAALATLSSIKNLPPIPRELSGQTLKVSLPISFELL